MANTSAPGAAYEAMTPEQRGIELLRAAQIGNADVVKSLLIAGVNREAKDQHGQTPLFGAVTGGHIEVVQHLLGAGANLSARNTSDTKITNIIPNEEMRSIFNLYDKSAKPNYNSINVGDKILVRAKHIISKEIQYVSAIVVEVTPQHYRVYPMKTSDFFSVGFEDDKKLLELFKFVFPHLFPDEERIENLSDANPYKTNGRLLDLLRSLNNTYDSLDERNKVIEEIYAMNISSINKIINKVRDRFIIGGRGIKVEFEYSPGVFAYYYYTNEDGLRGIFLDPVHHEKEMLPNITTNQIVSTNIMKYNLEQTIAIVDWVSDNILAHYLADPDIFKSTITNPFVGNERLWIYIENMFEHQYDLLYEAASPTPTERILYRGEKKWPAASSRRRTIFATSTNDYIARDFGCNVKTIKIPVGTRILDLSKDFNKREAEVLVFPTVRKTNLVIEPLPNGETVIIRNVNEERNRNLPRSRRRSRRNNKNRQGSMRRQRSTRRQQ